jgi:hypothetical protein
VTADFIYVNPTFSGNSFNRFISFPPFFFIWIYFFIIVFNI